MSPRGGTLGVLRRVGRSPQEPTTSRALSVAFEHAASWRSARFDHARAGTLVAVSRTHTTLVFGVSLIAGCTRLSDRQRFAPNPETIEVTQTVPASGSEAPRDVAVRLCWSDHLDPAALTDVDAVMGSGSLLTDAALSFELRPWTSPEGEPLDATAESPWCAGSVVTVTPKEPLQPGVRYRMRLADEAVGWEGERPDLESMGWVVDEDGSANFFVEFDIVDQLTPASVDPEVPGDPITMESLFAPGGVFDPERAMCSCHLDEEDDANILLDLRTADAAYEDLLFDSRLRDTGYPMVTPRRPSESFVLHKVLRDDGAPLPGVYGDAMPLGDMELPYGDYVMLARWIEDGALR